MSSKRRLRRQCRRKRAWAMYGEASAALKERLAHGDAGVEGTHVYKCRLCGKYHLGHRPARVVAIIEGRAGP